MLASKEIILENLKKQLDEVATPLETEPMEAEELSGEDGKLPETEETDAEEDWDENEDEGSILDNTDSLHVMLLKKDQDGVDRDILTTLHPSFGTLSNMAEGEFYFLDEEEIGVDLFVARIRVTTDIPPENGADLAALISLVNPNLVGGSFAYSPLEGELQYLLQVPLYKDTPEDILTSVVGSAMALSLSESQQFARNLVTFAKKS